MYGDAPLPSQMQPDELTAFLDGSSPPVIRMRCGRNSPLLRFVRGEDRLVRVEIPRMPHPSAYPFDIVAATDLPNFTAERTISEESIAFTMRTRSELRNAISIATIHLGWSNDDDIEYAFADT